MKRKLKANCKIWPTWIILRGAKSVINHNHANRDKETKKREAVNEWLIKIKVNRLANVRYRLKNTIKISINGAFKKEDVSCLFYYSPYPQRNRLRELKIVHGTLQSVTSRDNPLLQVIGTSSRDKYSKVSLFHLLCKSAMVGLRSKRYHALIQVTESGLDDVKISGLVGYYVLRRATFTG